VTYLHGNRLLELALLLYAVHEVASVDVFHNKVQTILHSDSDNNNNNNNNNNSDTAARLLMS
jgi:hypothetical protein